MGGRGEGRSLTRQHREHRALAAISKLLTYHIALATPSPVYAPHLRRGELLSVTMAFQQDKGSR